MFTRQIELDLRQHFTIIPHFYACLYLIRFERRRASSADCRCVLEYFRTLSILACDDRPSFIIMIFRFHIFASASLNSRLRFRWIDFDTSRIRRITVFCAYNHVCGMIGADAALAIKWEFEAGDDVAPDYLFRDIGKLFSPDGQADLRFVCFDLPLLWYSF